MTLKSKRLTAILIVILSLFVAVFACGSSDVNLGVMRNGKAEAQVTVSKSKVQDIATDLETFKTVFDGYLAKLNKAESEAKYANYLTAKSYSETETEFKVIVKTRRLEKIFGLGEVRYSSNKLFVNNAENIKDIENRYDGRGTVNLYRPAPDGRVQEPNYSLSMTNIGLVVKAKDLQTGKIVNQKDFISYLETDKNDRVVFFELGKFHFIDQITVKVPGKIKYVSELSSKKGQNLNQIKVDGNLITITPNVFYEKATNTTGTESGRAVDFCIGYFTYSRNISGFAIAGIVVGAIALGAFVYFGLVKGGVKRFFKGNVWKRMVRYKTLYLLLLPAFALLIMFRYMPMVWLSVGFMDYKPLEGLNSEWVGMFFFKAIFTADSVASSTIIYRLFRNTIFISLIRILSNLPVILFLALLVHSIKQKQVKTAFQTVSFIPYFLSWVSVGGIFYAMLDPNAGFINRAFGLDLNWYNDPAPWWAILSVSSLWKGMGWGTLIYISAMCNIDAELYEACSLDGGGMFRQAFTVTLPGIMNIICLQLILDVSNIMRDNYEQVYAMTNGKLSGTIKETADVIGRVAHTAMSEQNFASATALGLVQGVIGSLLVLITNKVVKKTDNEGII